MVENKIRIVVDTNVFISFLIGKSLKTLRNKIVHKEIQLLMSFELMEVIIQVTQREKFKGYFSRNQIEELVFLINDLADFIEVNHKENICRDPKDNFLLALATEGNANILISGDKDLLTLKTIGNTKIVSFKDFELP